MVTTHPQSGRPTPEAAPEITHTVPERSSAAPVADPDAASVPELLSELHWRERHLSVRDAVLAIVNRATSLDAALQASLDEICVGLEWDAGAVYLVNRKAGTFDLTAQRGLNGRAVTAMRALPLGQWPLAAVLAGDDVQRFDRLDVRPEAPSWARAAGLVEWIGAPLASPDGTLGVICVASHRERSERGISWNDEALLRAVGRNLGVTVDHLRTHLQIQAALSERNARWTALYNTGVAVTRELDSEALLDEIVRRSVDLLAAGGGVLSLLDEASGEIVVAVAYRRDAQPWPIRGRRLKAGEGINGAVLASRQPLIIENYAEWPGHMADLEDQAVSIVAVPLLVGDHVRGVLAVSDTAARGRFTEEHVQTLALFAQQAAAVWEHQRNRRQAEALTLHAERARLARDLHDGLAQDLASLLLRADLCQTLADSDDAALHVQLEAISTGLQRCIRDARATIFALRLPDSDTCSLEGNLAVLASQFESQTHIPIRYAISGEACQPLPKSHEIALLRVAQEALSNVRKHAQATQTAMNLTWHAGGSVSLKITDDGVGFDPAAVPGVNGAGQHFGVVSMRERMADLGGSLTLQSSPGGGTCLEVRLPAPAGG